MIECYHCGTDVEQSKSVQVQHTERDQTERICPTCTLKQTDGQQMMRDLDH